MTGYIIYVLYDLINETMSYEINDIECTIGNLFDKILKIDSNIYDVLFGNKNLSMLNKNTMLADIGLGSDCQINVSTKYSPLELKIITEYSLKHLKVYKDSYNYRNYNDDKKIYQSFTKDYIGRYPPEHLNDFFMELLTEGGRFILPNWVRLDYKACLKMLEYEYEWLDKEFIFRKTI